MPKFTVKVAGDAPTGLVVTVNGVSADPSLDVPLPVDPGPVIAAAHAPEHKDWQKIYNASEGKTLTIEVPALEPLPKPPVPPPPMTAIPTSSTPLVLSEDNSGTRHSRHVVGISMLAIGVAGVATGGFFGEQASSKWTGAKNDCGGASVTGCPSSGLSAAQGAVSDAKTAALISDISFGVGGAMLLTGAIIYLSAPDDVERRATTALRITPSVAPGSAGLVVGGQF